VHIGVLTTSYPRATDDPAGAFVAGLDRYLRGTGHTVEVLCAGEAGPAPAREMAAAGEGALEIVRRIPSALFYHGGAPDALAAGPSAARARAIASAAAFSLRLLRLCRRRAPAWDAVVSHWLVPCAAAAVLAAPRLPHLMIAHSSDVHLLRRLRLLPLVRALGRRGDLVYTAAALQVPGAPGRVVPMGIDAAAFAPPGEAERRAARAALGLRRPSALFLGRLVPVKGVSVLLDALAREGRYDRYDLLIAGDGPCRAALAGQAAALGDRVRLLGEVRGGARRELLAAADALVLPSLRLPDGRTEGAPTVLMEALCAGLPVVCSDVGAARDIVQDAGVVVPPGDRARLAEALRRVTGLAPPERDALRVRAAARGARFDCGVVGPSLVGPWLARLERTPPVN